MSPPPPGEVWRALRLQKSRFMDCSATNGTFGKRGAGVDNPQIFKMAPASGGQVGCFRGTYCLQVTCWREGKGGGGVSKRGTYRYLQISRRWLSERTELERLDMRYHYTACTMQLFKLSHSTFFKCIDTGNSYLDTSYLGYSCTYCTYM